MQCVDLVLPPGFVIRHTRTEAKRVCRVWDAGGSACNTDCVPGADQHLYCTSATRLRAAGTITTPILRLKQPQPRTATCHEG